MRVMVISYRTIDHTYDDKEEAMNAVLPRSVIPSVWRWHYKVLTKLHDELCETRQRGLEKTTLSREWHDSDRVDSVSEEFVRELAINLLSSEMDALYEVDAAISRIEDGTYGICERSGQPIPKDRLRAVPWSRYSKTVAEDVPAREMAPYSDPLQFSYYRSRLVEENQEEQESALTFRFMRNPILAILMICLAWLGFRGATAHGADIKWVEVDKSKQVLRAYEGVNLVLETHISTGRWDGSTPNGIYAAGVKYRMHYSNLYGNAAMPFSVQVTGNVFIHGYSDVPAWPASHGCIRVPMDGSNPAKQFYDWVDQGTPIFIIGRWQSKRTTVTKVLPTNRVRTGTIADKPRTHRRPRVISTTHR